MPCTSIETDFLKLGFQKACLDIWNFKFSTCIISGHYKLACNLFLLLIYFFSLLFLLGVFKTMKMQVCQQWSNLIQNACLKFLTRSGYEDLIWKYSNSVLIYCSMCYFSIKGGNLKNGTGRRNWKRVQ